MAATSHVIFVLGLTFIPFVLADGCDAYTDSSFRSHPSQECGKFQHCCGTCDSRYCCQNLGTIFDEDSCNSRSDDHNIVAISSTILGFVIFIVLIISCCVCPCCCLYKICRQPTPVIATTTTTVVQPAYPPPPSASQPYQGTQYPGYQPVSVQPGYGGQPTAPYQGQPFSPTYQGQPLSPGYQGLASGPPPPYQEPGAGYSPAQAAYGQAGYAPGQMAYPLQPPTQPGYPPQPDQSATQPAYNPAYMEPPKTGY